MLHVHIIHDGEELIGAVEVVVPELLAGGARSLRGRLPEAWAARELRFEVALIDLGGGGLIPGEELLRPVPADPEALALPGPF